MWKFISIPNELDYDFNRSGSDSGCPDEEKKQDTDPNSQEEFIRISSHTFRQLQNEVKFLRDQLATLHNLFCTDYEVCSNIFSELIYK